MTEDFPSKAFTVDEANRLVGAMERVMAEIERLGGEVEEHHRRLQILDALWGPKVLAEENPDHAEFIRDREKLDAIVERIECLVRDEILAKGVRFPPGGVEQGLLDFSTTLDGRWVYLCWMRGEPSVEHWHEITDGFAGRQHVTPDHESRMGTQPLEPS